MKTNKPSKAYKTADEIFDSYKRLKQIEREIKLKSEELIKKRNEHWEVSNWINYGGHYEWKGCKKDIIWDCYLRLEKDPNNEFAQEMLEKHSKSLGEQNALAIKTEFYGEKELDKIEKEIKLLKEEKKQLESLFEEESCLEILLHKIKEEQQAHLDFVAKVQEWKQKEIDALTLQKDNQIRDLQAQIEQLQANK